MSNYLLLPKFLILHFVVFYKPILKAEYAIIWNVGQGQAISIVNKSRCNHFDFGGEKLSWGKYSNACSKKYNLFFLSHLDWDHISFLKKLNFSQDNLCLHYPFSLKARNKSFLLPSKFESCTMGNKVHKIYQKEHKSSNGSSIVYAYDKLLFPGDSGSQQEKHWSKHSYINKIEILVLGHHGSKTSTSDLLLTKLPKLKYAISSARYAKYRHPHNSVLARLNLHKIIVLKTEDWGNIIFEL